MYATASLLIRLGVRSLTRNRKRSAVTVTAVALAVWSALCLSSIARGVSHRMASEAIKTLTGHVQIHRPGFLDDPSIRFAFSLSKDVVQNALGDIPVAGITARIRVPGVLQSERQAGGVTLVGIDPADERTASFYGTVPISGNGIESAGRGGVVLGAKLIDKLETAPGRRVVVLAEGESESAADRGYRIVGSFDAELESTELSFAFFPREVLAEQLGIPGKITEVSILLAEDKDTERALERLRGALPDYDVESWRAIEPFIDSLTKVQGGFLRLWFGFVVVTVAFGLVNTIFMGIFERKREIAMVQALGMTSRQVILQVVSESVVLIVPGLVAGSIFFFVTFLFLSQGIDLSSFSRGFHYVGVSSMVYPRFRFDDYVVLNLLVVVIAVSGSIYPAWRASQYNIVSMVAER